jgi:uncharacterized membrane protein
VTRNQLGSLSAFLVTAMALSAAGAGMSLPAELRLPIHWDLSGAPDNYAGKWVALLLPAAFTGAISLLAWFLPAIEPRSLNLVRSRGLYLWSWAAMLLFGVVIEVVVLSTAFGWGIPADRLIVGACGLLLLIVGNQLGKSRSMYMIGLRTPWTLASEEVWVRTHRLAGKLMVVAGLAVGVAAVLPLRSALLTTALLVSIILAAVVPILYSFLLWRRERRAADAAQSGE